MAGRWEAFEKFIRRFLLVSAGLGVLWEAYARAQPHVRGYDPMAISLYTGALLLFLLTLLVLDFNRRVNRWIYAVLVGANWHRDGGDVTATIYVVSPSRRTIRLRPRVSADGSLQPLTLRAWNPDHINGDIVLTLVLGSPDICLADKPHRLDFAATVGASSMRPDSPRDAFVMPVTFLIGTRTAEIICVGPMTVSKIWPTVMDGSAAPPAKETK